MRSADLAKMVGTEEKSVQSHKRMSGRRLAHRDAVPLLQGQHKNRTLDCRGSEI